MPKKVVNPEMTTYISIIVDESGSMHSNWDITISAYNEFLEDQKRVEGDARITLTKFNSTSTVVYENIPLLEAPVLDRETYAPAGCTALCDAVGQTIRTLESQCQDKKNTRALIMILTDGHENSSREFDTQKIKNLIKEKEEEGNYTFVFLSATIDAFDSGEALGIGAGNIARYAIGNVEGTMRALSSATTGYRESGGLGTQSLCSANAETFGSAGAEVFGSTL